jgi:N-acetylmuramoyl-L-alanine amidase
MTPLFAYLLKVIICSGILYGYYWIALRNKVFHSWNRFYLLASMAVSISLPLIEPYVIKPITNDSKMIHALQVVAGADEYVTEIQETSSMSWDTAMLMNTAYILITLIVMCWLFFGLTRIYKMVRRYPQKKMQDIVLLNTREPGTPFSYFRYLFWNEDIDPSSVNGQKILEHELVHIREKHSHDKLFVHLVLTIFWSNPFFWLIRKELAMVHEFIADQKTATDTESFAQLILSASFPQHTSLLTNAYFQSSIKRRITMITKNKNPKYQYISRILLIPVLFVLIFTFAVKAKGIMNHPSIDLDKKVTVVIDAGHGGTDNGVENGNVTEKDLNLALAKRIKELNNNSNLNIVLSRDVDQSLKVNQRPEIADNVHADLFLSLHSNGSPNNKKQGIEVFISAKNPKFEKESTEVATLLLNNLSSVYLTDKEIKKREKHGVWVLDKNNRPSIILENGYLTNENDKNFFTQSANQDKVAKAILRSIEDYFSKNVVVTKITTDTLPNTKKVKSVTVAYDDGTKEILTEEEYKKRNQPKVVKGIKLSKVDTVNINDVKVESVFFIDGKELPKGTMPIEVKEIQSIRVIDNGNGKKEVHIDKKESSQTKSNSPLNEVTVVGRPSATVKLKGQKINGVDPLYIINGKEYTKEQMSALEPNQIESIDVLKGESAITLFGDKGKNGVIKITLKK